MTVKPSQEDTGTNHLPTCRCGFDRNHYRVTRDGKYSGIGWFLMSMGISVEPSSVSWRCRVCNERFDHSTDPMELRKRY